MLNIRAAKVSILLTEKLLFSYINELQNIYVVLWIWTNCMLNISILDDLSTFEYFEIMMMLKDVNDMWSSNELCDCKWWLGIL